MNAEELARLAVRDRGAIQKEAELAWLASQVEDLRPVRVLEIGIWRGGTLWLWATIAAKNATIVGLDADVDSCEKLDLSPDRNLVLLNGNSHEPKTFARVSKVLDGPLDFLFVDGDHTFEGTKRDWETYGPLVRPGGIVAFHDLNGDTPPSSEVGRFWRSLDVPAKSSFFAPEEPWGGVGLVRITSEGTC